MKKSFIKTIYLFIGSFFLLIGIIGIFLPLLPTTPFLLLTAFCFERGSDNFHGWLINHKYFGPPIIDWQKNRVIKTKYKMLACSMMLITAIFLLKKPNVPLVGKLSYCLFMIAMMSFIITRKGKSN